MEPGILREQMNEFARQRLFSNHFVLPDYESLNVRNIHSLIAGIYRIDSLAEPKLPSDYLDDYDGVDTVVLFVMDGFGYNRLLNHVSDHQGIFSEIIRKGKAKPLTSTFPATTSTALTSIYTGLQPSEHGILGYHMFSSEYGLIFDTLDMTPVYGHSSDVDISDEYTHKIKPWMPTLNQNDIETLLITKSSIVGSGLSRIVHRDQETISYVLPSDMFAQCKRAVDTRHALFVLVYYSGIDTLEHRYGPYSDETTYEIESFESSLSHFISKLSDGAKKRTLMILTADHGVSQTSRFYYLKDNPRMMNSLLLPPTGDSRAAFLYSKPDKQEQLKQAFNDDIRGFELFPSEELLAKGVYGSTPDFQSMRTRIGDFTALSISQNAIQYPFFEDDRRREQRGSHGGMTPEEMIVPLLSIRLSKL